MPHGQQFFARSQTMAMALNVVLPSDTALTTAVRSAQIVPP
jgi:hypothetical protein